MPSVLQFTFPFTCEASSGSTSTPLMSASRVTPGFSVAISAATSSTVALAALRRTLSLAPSCHTREKKRARVRPHGAARVRQHTVAVANLDPPLVEAFSGLHGVIPEEHLLDIPNRAPIACGDDLVDLLHVVKSQLPAPSGVAVQSEVLFAHLARDALHVLLQERLGRGALRQEWRCLGSLCLGCGTDLPIRVWVGVR